jgi:hypothetical protein
VKFGRSVKVSDTVIVEEYEPRESQPRESKKIEMCHIHHAEEWFCY